ncbi:MAG TPA: hypothetical protein VFY14_03885, partial [Streptomyces sp.]|nr:hypothetical protein [Streptomyces sp.]
MITVTDLAESLGTGLLQVVVPGRETDIHDIVLAEPGDTTGQPGELVLGIGLADREAAVTLLGRAAAAGAA